MTKPSLILIGAGGHSDSCIDVVEEHNIFQIAGLIGLPHERYEQRLGYTVVGTDKDLPSLAKIYDYAVIATGQIQNSSCRIRLFQQVTQLGFKLPTIIAPSAYVSRHATIALGTIIMHRAVVNAGVSIGANCIINSCALLEHDVSVEDHCHISTGAILNGGVAIGSGSFVGSASVIKQGVKIGKNCLIGMGLSVRHDLISQAKFLGD
ncbi:NeuD/PglB/VioB family sugar acetyltransferase [Polynucleobacter necessarius]|uniref:NeuD/PglB/VioB family sugar acetyltransferase n=1 Tax=Polynucleobacter necessarius TaxID=576610 RepID=UPI000E09CB9E|nr:NeuD/PglB/VioB family sugar acetyltransferase [Polynucleobacter necessarius]HAT39101.1 acetyltransferase [Polynucleobacter sp.]